MNKPKISRDFDPDIARDVGTDAAIIFENIWYWINFNQSQRDQTHFHEEKWWTYNSIRGFQELFYYLTEEQIRHCLDKLIDKNYLVKGNFNKTSYDRTLWYSLGENEKIDLGNFPNGDGKNNKPIPYDKPVDNPIIVDKPIVNTPEEAEEQLGESDSLKERREAKEALKAKKVNSFLKSSFRPSSSADFSKPKYEKKRGGVAYYGQD